MDVKPAPFSFAFASFHSYGTSLGGRFDDAERARYSRSGDRFWLLGCVALWLVYLVFAMRFFPPRTDCAAALSRRRRCLRTTRATG